MVQEIWTILDENSLPVLTFTSFISLESDNGATITDYVSEKGAFSTYNKIVSPDELSVALAVQGDSADLQNAISILDTLRKEPQKVSIVSPYKEFKWFSLENYSYSFNSTDGLGLLVTLLKFKQINEVEPAYTAGIKYPKNPTAASSVNGGKKQPKSLLKQGQDALTKFMDN